MRDALAERKKKHFEIPFEQTKLPCAINNVIKCQLIKLILSESKQITRKINTHQKRIHLRNAESVAVLAANEKR